jgi:hypothetical protein
MTLLKQTRHRWERMLDAIDKRFYSDFGPRFRNWRLGIHRSDYHFSRSQLAFVHLPKTGGTSLNSIFAEGGRDRFTGVFCHRPISRKCPPGEYAYFTVMRDPVERVWSFYQMAQRKLALGGGPYYHLASRGLEFFLQQCWEARNMACRYYTGRVYHEPNSAVVEKAWVNLQQFRYVLSFEALAEDAAMLLADYGLVGGLPHRNRHRYEGPEPEERELITVYNALDIELHRRWAARREERMFLSEGMGETRAT